ncbi:unnamed protein product, partial [Laminaria digitata]
MHHGHGRLTYPLSRKERDERGASAASSLLIELGSSTSGTGAAHHGMVDLSERGLVLTASSNADTIPADVPSSSSLCSIERLALPVPVAVSFLPSQYALETSPKCGASCLIGSQPTAAPAVIG